MEDGFIGEHDAFERLAVFVDESAAKQAAKNSGKDPDWGKGTPETLFAELFSHEPTQPLLRQQ